MIFAFTPFILALWKRQADPARTSTVMKMAFGCFGVAPPTCPLAAAASAGGGRRAGSG